MLEVKKTKDSNSLKIKQNLSPIKLHVYFSDYEQVGF
jgi:hypothetical protein